MKQQKAWPWFVAFALAVGTVMLVPTPNMMNGGMLIMILFFILTFTYKTALDYLIHLVNKRD